MNERIEDAVKRSATIFVEYVPGDRRAGFEKKVAELAGRGLATVGGE
jgi:hypothetical protein